MKTIKQKIRSVILCLEAHPDNEPDSEFADRLNDLYELEGMIKEYAKEYAREALRNAAERINSEADRRVIKSESNLPTI